MHRRWICFIGVGKRQAVTVKTGDVRLQVQNSPMKRREVSGKSHFNDAARGFIDKLGEIELMQVGGSLKFCRIAEGSADVYPRLGPTCERDAAVAQTVLEGVGGHVIDLNGAGLRYGKRDVIIPYFIAMLELKLFPND